MQPLFQIQADAVDISTAVGDRLIDLVVTDEAGIQSDELKLTLDDRRRADGAIAQLPRIGSVLDVSLTYAGRPGSRWESLSSMRSNCVLRQRP